MANHARVGAPSLVRRQGRGSARRWRAARDYITRDHCEKKQNKDFVKFHCYSFSLRVFRTTPLVVQILPVFIRPIVEIIIDRFARLIARRFGNGLLHLARQYEAPFGRSFIGSDQALFL